MPPQVRQTQTPPPSQLPRSLAANQTQTVPLKVPPRSRQQYRRQGRLRRWCSRGVARTRIRTGTGTETSSNEKVITFVKLYGAEAWIYRGRVVAVLSTLILLSTLIVRTCHQQYQRIIIIALCFNFLCFLGCCHILYYTTHGPPTTSMRQAQLTDA